MLFNLDFANNTILSCFLFFFWTIELYFLIASVISQFFNPIAKLVTPKGIPNKEAKIEMETHSVILESTIRMWSIYQNSTNFFMVFIH